MSGWIPLISEESLDDLADVDLTGLADGDYIAYDSGSGLWLPAAPAGGVDELSELIDVDLTGLADGDFIQWDSGAGLWLPVSAPSGAASEWAVDLTDNSDPADIVWDGSQSAGMTTVTVTGTQTITEKTNVLSVLYSGQGANDFNALLAAHTFSVGDSFAVSVRTLSHFATSNQGNAALIFTDGTTSAANAMAANLQQNANNPPLFAARHGTLTLLSTNTTQAINDAWPWAWLRLTYTASNTFQVSVSPDGISYTTLAHAATAKTMTPTHFGIAWSKDNTGNEGIATFGPILKVA